MRVTAIHRYFWPDVPPYASILRRIAEGWADAGHEVSIVSCQPSYGTGSDMPKRPGRERIGPLDVRRVPIVRRPINRWTTLGNFVAFPLLAAIKVMTMRRPDVVMCSTAPQVVTGFAVSLAARLRGSAFVYHCMDLHPEVGAISGEFANPLIYRLLLKMEVATMRRATAVVVLSGDMEASVLRRDPSLWEKVHVINNFALPDYSEHQEVVESQESGQSRGERVVFAGNIGRFQGLEAIVEALHDVSGDRSVELIFMGEGKAKDGLVNLANEVNSSTRHTVKFLPQGSPAAARALMRSADVGIVSLVPEIVKFAYPSKTATYMSEGLPILVICEPESQLARNTEEWGLGWTAVAGDRDSLATSLEAIARVSEEEKTARRRRVQNSYEETFSEKRLLERWELLLQQITSSGREEP